VRGTLADENAEDPIGLKKRIREQAHQNRDALPNKDALSRDICATLASLPEHSRAKAILYYVDVRSEVRTRHFLPAALAQGRTIIVPYCVNNELALFPKIPTQAHDVFMDKIVTEKTVYTGRGRGRQ
jgi:5-formyltetrahydrofolate cyclo-ligase